jgi:Flp pilus assembly pilin Flp
MKNMIRRFLTEESGQDIAEYALLLVLVGIAIAIASPNITDAILSVFASTSSVLS